MTGGNCPAVGRGNPRPEMERNPSVGCCPGCRSEKRAGDGAAGVHRLFRSKQIVPWRKFLKKLLKMNFVLAASGRVRRMLRALRRFSAGHAVGRYWYLRCLFALHFDVAYFADGLLSTS